MSEQNEQSNVAVFKELKFPVIEYGVTEAQIAEVAERYKEPDASTDEGYERCKEGCKVLRAMRTSVETRRLDLKRPITEWVRVNVDVRGKELIRQIRAAESPVRAEKERADEIKQAEARREAEAEQKRIADIRERIDTIEGAAREQHPDDNAANYNERIDLLNELQITEEVFAEFVDEANTARDAALFKLTQWHEQALQREADDVRRKEEQARLDKEREELEAAQEKQRQAEAELEQEKREAEKREAAAKSELEQRNREADERKAEQEKAATEKAEQEKETTANVERERVAHIRASITAYEDARCDLDGRSSVFLSNSLTLLQGDPPREDEFQELLTEAREAWQETIDTLEIMLKDAGEREEKARRDEEARLPDKDKLVRWCDAIASIPEPEVLNDKAQKILKRYGGDLTKLTDRLCSDIQKL